MLDILEQMPEPWREALILNARDGLAPDEIGLLEGVARDEVERRIELARAFLDARLADEFRDTQATPLSAVFVDALDRLVPTAEQRSRLRRQLEAA